MKAVWLTCHSLGKVTTFVPFNKSTVKKHNDRFNESENTHVIVSIEDPRCPTSYRQIGLVQLNLFQNAPKKPRIDVNEEETVEVENIQSTNAAVEEDEPIKSNGTVEVDNVQ